MAALKRKINVGGEEVEIPAVLNRSTIGLGIVVIFVLILIGSSLYSVGPDEEGVIQRFGKYVRTTEPGLHLKIPFGVETVKKVKVKFIFKEEFGFRTVKAGVRTVYSGKSYLAESLMLTGDLNLAVVEWIVQYRIKNAKDYLFQVRDVEETLRDISEAVMREVVGDRSVSEVLTTGRMEVALEVQQKLQKILDDYNSGIKVGTVKLQDVNPPDVVKPAFNDVNEAKQEKERMINQAWESYNKAVPLAKGEAKKMIQSAEGYALNRINRSKGDEANFIAVWRAYNSARDVTRRRLYLETLNEVLPKVKQKYIIDESQEGLLPFLQLQKGGLR
jgi:membrane protease subunit HflK